MRLILRASSGLAFLLAIIAAALFATAGSFGYWQAWTFLAVFAAAVIAITVDLANRDPALLERRVHAGPLAEKQRAQQAIQSLASLAFIGIFVVAGFDHRNSWSHVPTAAAITGDALVALGLWLVFRVFRANTFTAATIEVGTQQRLVSTGPYAIVRHPMYAGATVMLLGVPLALGSWWGLAPMAALIAVIVLRLLDEEQFLIANLAGYAEYREKVRSRLVPHVW